MDKISYYESISYLLPIYERQKALLKTQTNKKYSKYVPKKSLKVLTTELDINEYRS